MAITIPIKFLPDIPEFIDLGSFSTNYPKVQLLTTTTRDPNPFHDADFMAAIEVPGRFGGASTVHRKYPVVPGMQTQFTALNLLVDALFPRFGFRLPVSQLNSSFAQFIYPDEVCHVFAHRYPISSDLMDKISYRLDIVKEENLDRYFLEEHTRRNPLFAYLHKAMKEPSYAMRTDVLFRLPYAPIPLSNIAHQNEEVFDYLVQPEAVKQFSKSLDPRCDVEDPDSQSRLFDAAGFIVASVSSVIARLSDKIPPLKDNDFFPTYSSQIIHMAQGLEIFRYIQMLEYHNRISTNVSVSEAAESRSKIPIYDAGISGFSQQGQVWVPVYDFKCKLTFWPRRKILGQIRDLPEE